MDLNNQVEINAPVDVVWEAVNDVERIAPCLPGAQLQEIDDEAEEFRGIVKVKVGPITAQYKGAASFAEQDAGNRRIRLEAKGRDSRGAGTANAVITATLEEMSGGKTVLTVDTDLTVTGKVAQFGRGAMADVSAKLMEQFADNLGAMLDEGPTATPVPEEPGTTRPGLDTTYEPSDVRQPSSSVRPVDGPGAEPVDLMGVAGGSIAKRVAPVIGVIVALLIVRWIIRRMRD